MAAILMISAISTDNTALAQSVLDRYTKERPLTVIADWEFPPSDYRDDQGNPAGYNAEITSIMQRSYFVLPDHGAIRSGLRQIENILRRLKGGEYAITTDFCEALSMATNAYIILKEVEDR